MSVAVDISKLATELERYGPRAFVVSVRDDATPHLAHAAFRLVDGVLRCGASRTAAANVASRPRISVLWPAFEPDGYSMIVDGECEVSAGTGDDGGDELVVTPTKGVLHRSAALPDPSCITLSRPT